MAAPFDAALFEAEECVDEIDELDAKAMPYQPAKQPGNKGGAPPDFKNLDESDLFELLEAGAFYWRTTEEIAYRRAQEGASPEEVEDELREALDRVPPASQQDPKWKKAGASLPKWVSRAFKRAAKATKKLRGGGRPLHFAQPKPWADTVDGAELLDEIADVCRKHVVMPEAAAHAVALWVLHTYVFGAALVTPRLLLKSAQKRSGKTTCLMLVGAMSSRALPSAGISAAAVYRTIEQVSPTLLIDEADTFLPENEELRGVLNAGYLQGGQVIRAVGDDFEPRVFSCWCPVAIAAINRLPDTVEDRSVAITLQRRRKDEPVTRLRLGQLALLAPIASRAQRWADDNAVALETADPVIPDALNDRAADCWRILLAIAERAGEAWAERGRAAAVKLAMENADTETLLTQLLADIRDLFDAGTAPVFTTAGLLGPSTAAMFSADIVAALGDMEDRPWPEYGKRRLPLTVSQLARLLAPLRIHPSNLRHGARLLKGYRRDQLDDAIARYLA